MSSATSARFEGRWCPLGSVNLGVNLSPDFQAATFLFDSLMAQVWDEAPGPSARAMTIRLPMLNNPDGVRVNQDLRGFVQADPGARITLTIESGGVAKVVDLAAARLPGSGGYGSDPGAGYNFMARVEAVVKPGWDYYATVVVTVERTAPGARAQLQLDSLDVSIVPPS